MFIQLFTFLCTIQILTEEYRCSDFMDLPSDSGEPDLINYMVFKTYSNNTSTFVPHVANLNHHVISRRTGKIENPDDVVFKQIISGLAQQSVLDYNRTLHSLDNIRNIVKNEVAYQIGFITRYIKHQRDLMNDFFDLAIKNREHVLILQQMNVFEHIMHTSVNITNLVKRIISIHIKHKNNNKPTPPQNITLPKVESSQETTTHETAPTTGRRLYPLRTKGTAKKLPYNNFYQNIKIP